MPEETTFDSYAANYDAIQQESMGVLGRYLNVYAEYKIKQAAKILPRHPTSILEFGCGTGRNLPYFRRYFPDAKLEACDVSEQSLAIAKEQGDDVEFFSSASLDALTRRKEKYDLCFLSGVMHHIPITERMAWLEALHACTAFAGCIIIFEHNPYNPMTRRIVSNCPYDADASLIAKSFLAALLKQAGFKLAESAYTLLFPWRLGVLERIESWFGRFPLGGQYYVLAEKCQAKAK